MIKFLLLLLVFFSFEASAQITGKWKTIDDNTGRERSVIEIYEENDQFFGRIVKLILEEGDDPDPVCDECEDHRKDQKVIGMKIIEDMQKDDENYTGGKILDPENGKIYRCKMWLEEGTLKVRGYLYFFFRTQTWYKYE